MEWTKEWRDIARAAAGDRVSHTGEGTTLKGLLRDALTRIEELERIAGERARSASTERCPPPKRDARCHADLFEEDDCAQCWREWVLR